MRNSAAFAAFVVALAVGGSLSHGKDDLNVHGRPDTFEPGKQTCYAIWFEGGKWHLRTSAGRREHPFKGTITVHGGKVTEVKGLGLEASGAHADRFGLTRDKHKIVFDFKTDDGGEDGIDFDVDEAATAILWDIEIGSDRGGLGHDKERVLVGKHGEHPEELPFQTKARPHFVKVEVERPVAPAAIDESLHIYGRPESFEPGKMSCIAVWFDDGKWHLRTSAGRREHEFKGVITVHGGKVTELKGLGLEKGGEHKDRFGLGPEHRKIVFDFKTDDGGEDGIDFDTDEGAQSITWDLQISGDRGNAAYDKARILVGKNGAHPATLPFGTKARPRWESNDRPVVEKHDFKETTLHVFGRPDDFRPGKQSCIALWYEDGKWHLRTSAGRREHEFKGTITVHGGKVTELKGLGLEAGGAHKDRFGLGPEHRKISFDFKTDDGGEDGIDFDTTDGAECITWELSISGTDRRREKAEILVGKKGEHPTEMPFDTKARPHQRGR